GPWDTADRHALVCNGIFAGFQAQSIREAEYLNADHCSAVRALPEGLRLASHHGDARWLARDDCSHGSAFGGAVCMDCDSANERATAQRGLVVGWNLVPGVCLFQSHIGKLCGIK